jgi:hypothetical protein
MAASGKVLIVDLRCSPQGLGEGATLQKRPRNFEIRAKAVLVEKTFGPQNCYILEKYRSSSATGFVV